MKKIFAGLFLLLASFTAQSQTVDEILAKYETAVGGREKLEGVKQLEMYSTVKMGMMGQTIELPVTLVREKGKLYRRQVGGIMGMGDSYTMVTDTSGYVFIPAMRSFGPDQQGTQATLIPMKPEEITSQQYELDCAGAFGELVNYAAKGHKAELLGTEKVSKVPCFKIKLTLKTGQVLTYYIDSQTFLVKQLEATGEMAQNLTGLGGLIKAFGSNMGKNIKASILVKEYGDFAGLKFPVKYNLGFGPVESEVETSTVKINEGLEEKWYHPTILSNRGGPGRN
jgi:hypothetical protein